jgi:hypothetical protein
MGLDACADHVRALVEDLFARGPSLKKIIDTLGQTGTKGPPVTAPTIGASNIVETITAIIAPNAAPAARAYSYALSLEVTLSHFPKTGSILSHRTT